MLDGMVEAVYGGLDVPTGADWRSTMRQRATAMREALQRHPWVEELGASGYDYTGQFQPGLELILDGIEQLRHQRQGGVDG